MCRSSKGLTLVVMGALAFAELLGWSWFLTSQESSFPLFAGLAVGVIVLTILLMLVTPPPAQPTAVVAQQVLTRNRELQEHNQRLLKERQELSAELEFLRGRLHRANQDLASRVVVEPVRPMSGPKPLN